MQQSSPRVRPLGEGELAVVLALLEREGLPLAGVDSPATRLWVAEVEGRPVGAVGLERHGGEGLLRSLVVDRGWRGEGVGARLGAAVLEQCRREALASVFLLTTTAERWFPRLGFEAVGRDEVPAELAGSEELKGACPATAVVMRRPLP
jgi:amino-acid N-acetyltransferase